VSIAAAFLVPLEPNILSGFVIPWIRVWRCSCGELGKPSGTPKEIQIKQDPLSVQATGFIRPFSSITNTGIFPATRNLETID